GAKFFGEFPLPGGEGRGEGGRSPNSPWQNQLLFYLPNTRSYSAMFVTLLFTNSCAPASSVGSARIPPAPCVRNSARAVSFTRNHSTTGTRPRKPVRRQSAQPAPRHPGQSRRSRR